MARKLTPDQMVSPRAFAPFEVAEVFAHWTEMEAREAKQQIVTHQNDPDACNGLGPPRRLLDERPADFGERCAVALFTLIKEI